MKDTDDEQISEWINQGPSGGQNHSQSKPSPINPQKVAASVKNTIRLNQSQRANNGHQTPRVQPIFDLQKELNEMPKSKRSQSCDRFQEPYNERSIAEQVDSNPKIDEAYKMKYKNLHKEMLTQVNDLNLENEKYFKAMKESETNLGKKEKELDQLATKQENVKAELNLVKKELTRVKEQDRQAMDKAADTELRLTQFENQFFQAEVDLVDSKSEIEDLRQENSKLLVEKMQAESKTEKLESSIKVLQGSIKLRDESLANKILNYDALFERNEKSSLELIKLADQSANLQSHLSKTQSIHIEDFKEVKNMVLSLSDRLDRMNDNLESMQTNEMTSIDTTLKQVRKIVVDDLGNEIEATTQKRLELNESHNYMTDSLKNIERDFKAHQARISKEVRRITSANGGDIPQLQTILQVVGAIIFILVGQLLSPGKNSSRY